MVKKYGSFALALVMCFCLGCAPKVETVVQYVDRPVYVEVPVVQEVVLETIPKPSIPVETLKSNATPQQVAQAYYDSVFRYKEYTILLESILERFQKKD